MVQISEGLLLLILLLLGLGYGVDLLIQDFFMRNTQTFLFLYRPKWKPISINVSYHEIMSRSVILKLM